MSIRKLGTNSPRKVISYQKSEEKRIDLLGNNYLPPPPEEEKQTTTTIYEESLEMKSNSSSFNTQSRHKRNKSLKALASTNVFDKARRSNDAFAYVCSAYYDPIIQKQFSNTNLNSSNSFKASKNTSINNSSVKTPVSPSPFNYSTDSAQK